MGGFGTPTPPKKKIPQYPPPVPPGWNPAYGLSDYGSFTSEECAVFIGPECSEEITWMLIGSCLTRDPQYVVNDAWLIFHFKLLAQLQHTWCGLTTCICLNPLNHLFPVLKWLCDHTHLLSCVVWLWLSDFLHTLQNVQWWFTSYSNLGKSISHFLFFHHRLVLVWNIVSKDRWCMGSNYLNPHCHYHLMNISIIATATPSFQPL